MTPVARSLKEASFALKLSIQSYDVTSHRLTGNVLQAWGSYSLQKPGEEASILLWKDGRRRFRGADPSRDFKFGEIVIILGCEEGSAEAYPPKSSFIQKVDLLFNPKLIREVIGNSTVEELDDWCADPDLGEDFKEELNVGQIDHLVEDFEAEAASDYSVLSEHFKAVVLASTSRQRLRFLEFILFHPDFLEKSSYVTKTKEYIGLLGDQKLKGQKLFLEHLRADLSFHFLPLYKLLTEVFTAKRIEGHKAVTDLVVSRWVALLQNKNHPEFDQKFGEFWKSQSSQTKKNMAQAMVKELKFGPDFRLSLFELLRAEMLESQDPDYYHLLWPIITDDRFFSSFQTPQGMYFAKVLMKLSLQDKTFVPLLKQFYEICLENGASLHPEDVEKIKKILKG